MIRDGEGGDGMIKVMKYRRWTGGIPVYFCQGKETEEEEYRIR